MIRGAATKAQKLISAPCGDKSTFNCLRLDRDVNMKVFLHGFSDSRRDLFMKFYRTYFLDFMLSEREKEVGIPAGLVTNITMLAELFARSYFVLISLISLVSTFRIEKKCLIF